MAKLNLSIYDPFEGERGDASFKHAGVEPNDSDLSALWHSHHAAKEHPDRDMTDRPEGNGYFRQVGGGQFGSPEFR